MDMEIIYGYDEIFLCYKLNSEMMNYCCVQRFLEKFMWERHFNITNKSAPVERGVDLKV